MVTLILLFLFLSPRFIDFRVTPVETVALRSTEVLVKEAGQVGNSARFIYQIRIDVPGGPNPGQSEAERRNRHPACGRTHFRRRHLRSAPTQSTDAQKKIVAYDAWVLR